MYLGDRAGCNQKNSYNFVIIYRASALSCKYTGNHLQDTCIILVTQDSKNNCDYELGLASGPLCLVAQDRINN